MREVLRQEQRRPEVANVIGVVGKLRGGLLNGHRLSGPQTAGQLFKDRGKLLFGTGGHGTQRVDFRRGEFQRAVVLR